MEAAYQAALQKCGSSAKVIDNHTVGCSGGAAGIVAGTILDVTSDGVVIQIH